MFIYDVLKIETSQLPFNGKKWEWEGDPKNDLSIGL